MKDQQRTSIRCSPIYLENENLPTHVRLKTIFRDDLIEEYNDWRNLTNSQKTESINLTYLEAKLLFVNTIDTLQKL